MVTDSRGILKPFAHKRNPLAWLTSHSASQEKYARTRLAGAQQVDLQVQAGWFVVEDKSDSEALESLAEGRAERALALWEAEADREWAKHNRATLHRSLASQSLNDESRSHLCTAGELYLDLYRVRPQVTYYHQQVQSLAGRLVDNWDQDLRPPGPYCLRELKLIRAALPKVSVDELQSRRFARSVKDFQVRAAELQQQLLPFQGVAHIPVAEMVTDFDAEVREIFLPLAERYRGGLLDESSERRAVERAMAEVCAVLSWSYRKLENRDEALEWWSQACRWDAELEERTESGLIDKPADEAFPVLRMSKEADLSAQVEPRAHGLKLLGIGVTRTRPDPESLKEYWLESFMILMIPIFPLRRLRLYRDPDSGEVGNAQLLPLETWHHFWQGIVALVFSFALVAGLTSFLPSGWVPGLDRPVVLSPEERAQRTKEIEKALERLKFLAQEESRLVSLPEEQRKNSLQEIAQERAQLIEKIERLETK